MFNRAFLIGTLLLATIALSSCGERLTPEDALKHSVEANEQANRFQLHLTASQNVGFGDMTVEQKITAEGQFARDQQQYYLDYKVKNAAAAIDTSVYGDKGSYYVKSESARRDWSLLDDPVLTGQLDKSLMMDYDKPNEYLNLLLGDDNRMTLRSDDQETHIIVSEPTTKTKEALARYLMNNTSNFSQVSSLKIEMLSSELENMEIVIDDNTSLIQSLSIQQSVELRIKGDVGDKAVRESNMTIEQRLTVKYDHYDDTEIRLPDDLLEVIG